MTAAFPIGTSPPNPRTAWPLRVVASVVAMLVVGVGIGATAAAEPTAPPPPPPVATTPQQPAPTAPTPTPPPTSQVPSTPATPSPTPRGSWPGDSSQVPVEPSEAGDSDCGIRNISGCVANAIDGFFARLVDSALNPLLELLSQTLLTTPEPGDLPRVGELWDSSWHLMLAMYGLLVMAAGILLMVRETLQTRWSLQELLPRIVVGFIAGAMSMLLATQAIVFANALAEAFAGSGVESDSATTALKELTGSVTGNGIFLVLLRTALVVMLVVLLITYVVRVAITIILIVAAPLALMCHALPGLDSIARWWWRSFAACLAIQVVQSLVLVTTLRVFLTPGGWGFFGPNMDGVVAPARGPRRPRPTASRARRTVDQSAAEHLHQVRRGARMAGGLSAVCLLRRSAADPSRVRHSRLRARRIQHQPQPRTAPAATGCPTVSPNSTHRRAAERDRQAR